MTRTQNVMHMISRISKASLLVLSSVILFGCAIATVDLSGDAPEEDTAEISGVWGYYGLATKDCWLMAADGQETTTYSWGVIPVGARTYIVRPGLHIISVHCRQTHLSDVRTGRDLEIYAEPGHHYNIEWEIVSSGLCVKATDEDSKEVVDSACQ